MTTYKLSKRFAQATRLWSVSIIALMFIIGAIFFAVTPAYAADVPETDASPSAETQTPVAEADAPTSDETKMPDVESESAPSAKTQTLAVKEVWLTGDTLHISVADGGEGRTIELNLRDYAMPSDEYVTVQATDESGRESNSITFKNPYYVPQAEGTPSEQGGEGEPAAPDGAKPFTPDGTGTVVDNAADGDGKEFFTVETPDGNVFYLIVDRQRNTDNVYLLNAVTEDDLSSLAKPGDGKPMSSAEPMPPPAAPVPVTPEPTPEPTPPPVPEKNDNTATLAFVGIAALIIGVVAYYFKIVRPKKNGGESDFEPEDDFDDDEEVDIDADNEDGDDE